MAYKQSHLSAAVAPTLTGLGLAVSIAREAADAVPIVKQALGIVVRILAHAEKIDKDREALHSLAEKSLQLARRVRDVLDNEEPDERLLPSLERMYNSFQDVETFMSKHVARNRFVRGLSYAFTVNHHVERLSRNLDTALQEIVAVALLTINQDSQYDGEFRRIRECQVDRRTLIREDKHEEDGGSLIIRYYTAQVDGHLLVVRYCEGSVSRHTRPGLTTKATPWAHMTSHDQILKELSTVQRSHPNVARIYGWSKGSIYSRFTVFKSGFRPVNGLLDELPITTLIHSAFKDAVRHLEGMEISWIPGTSPYVLDAHLEPTIGLRNDLCRLGSNPLAHIYNQLYWSMNPVWLSSPLQRVSAADIRAALSENDNERLVSLLDGVETINRQRYFITKADFSPGLTLNDGTAQGLISVWEHSVVDAPWRVHGWAWADILLALDSKRRHRLIRGLHVVYLASRHGQDYVQMFGMVEDAKHIVYDWYYLDIPGVRRDEVRGMFGIPAPSNGEQHRWHLVATGGPGSYRASK